MKRKYVLFEIDYFRIKLEEATTFSKVVQTYGFGDCSLGERFILLVISDEIFFNYGLFFLSSRVDPILPRELYALSEISTKTLAVSAISFSSVLANSWRTFDSTSSPRERPKLPLFVESIVCKFFYESLPFFPSRKNS